MTTQETIKAVNEVIGLTAAKLATNGFWELNADVRAGTSTRVYVRAEMIHLAFHTLRLTANPDAMPNSIEFSERVLAEMNLIRNQA